MECVKFLTADELRAQLEAELAWRQEEFAFFKNQLNNIADENDKNRYRKSLVLILYSHMEGYIKTALQIYIQYINEQKLPRKKVVSRLMVAGMHKEFTAYENLDRKCKVFPRKLPKESSLHRFYRQVDFIEQIEKFKNSILIVQDEVIDTESNLWYIVLEKNLYKIGLPVDIFKQYEKEINELVNRRNSIAHGSKYSGIEEQDFSRLETKIFLALSDITRLLYEYANHHKYLQSGEG